VNLTALMQLPYPGPGDAPCDFDEQWCQFTSAIDGVFDRWEAGLSRAYPAIAAAKLLQTETITIINGNPIVMSEVTLDTAAMTNMDADPYGITVRRAGRYTVWGTIIETDTSGGAGAQSVLTLDFIGEQNTITVLSAGEYRNVVYVPVVSLPEGARITMSPFLSGQAIRTARWASLAVVWHSDGARP
jgi:hypothetical protein